MKCYSAARFDSFSSPWALLFLISVLSSPLPSPFFQDCKEEPGRVARAEAERKASRKAKEEHEKKEREEAKRKAKEATQLLQNE